MTTERPTTTADIVERTEAQAADSQTREVEHDRDAHQEQTPLIDADRGRSLLEHWNGIQAGFVDSPREAVQQADSLVAEVIQDLARGFADERGKLEHQWDSGTDVQTEDLRVALQRYRSFFQRLLAA